MNNRNGTITALVITGVLLMVLAVVSKLTEEPEVTTRLKGLSAEMDGIVALAQSLADSNGVIELNSKAVDVNLLDDDILIEKCTSYEPNDTELVSGEYDLSSESFTFGNGNLQSVFEIKGSKLICSSTKEEFIDKVLPGCLYSVLNRRTYSEPNEPVEIQWAEPNINTEDYTESGNYQEEAEPNAILSEQDIIDITEWDTVGIEYCCDKCYKTFANRLAASMHVCGVEEPNAADFQSRLESIEQRLEALEGRLHLKIVDGNDIYQGGFVFILPNNKCLVVFKEGEPE